MSVFSMITGWFLAALFLLLWLAVRAQLAAADDVLLLAAATNASAAEDAAAVAADRDELLRKFVVAENANVRLVDSAEGATKERDYFIEIAADLKQRVVALRAGDPVRVNGGSWKYRGWVYSITPAGETPEIPDEIEQRPVIVRGNVRRCSEVAPSVLVASKADAGVVLRRAPLNMIQKV